MQSHIERFFVPGLAHASYLILNQNEAAVVDPQREVDAYILEAKARGASIKAILNTHPHADFASGFMELAQKTGAKVYTSHLAPVTYPHLAAKENDVISLGEAQLRILETPGHSPDSLSFVLEEEQPLAVFTGDLLFVGDVGRPDLRDADADPTDLAGKLYDSLFDKIMRLPDATQIHPAHGAGSLCGRAIASEAFSTVARERADNWALKLTEKPAFVQEMIANLPDRPAYFTYDVGVNLEGAPALDSLAELRPVGAEGIIEGQQQGAQILDIRSAGAYGQGHLSGSLNIGIASHLFSTWTGFFIPGGSSIYLIAQTQEEATRARLELARIGYDQVEGYLLAEDLPEALCQTTQVSACDLRDWMEQGFIGQIIDVRTCGERKAAHIEGSFHMPLPHLKAKVNQLRSDLPTVVYCGSGYRSAIAASLLQATGFERVYNLMGGMQAWESRQCGCFEPAEMVYASQSE